MESFIFILFSLECIVADSRRRLLPFTILQQHFMYIEIARHGD